MHAPAPDPTPLLEPRSIAVVGANDRPGSYADLVLRNLARAGFEGDVWGVNPRRTEVHDRPCVPSVADLPEPVDAVVVAIPAAGVPAVIADAVTRGCGGAIVLSAGFGEIESGRGLEQELREAALAGGLPLCGPNGNGIFAVGSRAPMWGDSVAPMEPGRRGDDLPERQRRRQRARLAPRDPLPHGPLHGKPGGARRQRLAGGDLRARRGALGGDVPGGGRGRGAPGRGARPLRRARRPGGRAEGGRFRGRQPGGLGAHRSGRRRPASVPRPGRGGRRRLGRRPSRAAGAGARSGRAAGPAARRRRPRDPDLLGRRLEHRRRRGRPPRRRAARAGRRDPRATGGALAGRGDRRQPARLHRDDLGRHRPASPDHGHGRRPTPRSTSCWSCTTILRAWRRRRRQAGPRSGPGSSPAPTRPRPPPWSPPPFPT